MTHWRLATPRDVVNISNNLRQEDHEEAQAMYGVDPSVFLPIYHTRGRTWAFGVDGVDFGLAGVSPTHLDGVGQLWMVSTPDLYKNKTVFLRNSKAFIEEMHGYYPALFNYVDARQTQHLKWLKWLGFQAVDYKPCWGVAGIPFFEMIRIK